VVAVGSFFGGDIELSDKKVSGDSFCVEEVMKEKTIRGSKWFQAWNFSWSSTGVLKFKWSFVSSSKALKFYQFARSFEPFPDWQSDFLMKLQSWCFFLSNFIKILSSSPSIFPTPQKLSIDLVAHKKSI
jgi:hypothetical protein